MRKVLATLALAALAGGTFAGVALAEEVETPAGTLIVDESGSVEADGADTNPDPADGYLKADANGVCGADDGSSTSDPEDDGAGDCNDALVQTIVDDITGQLPA